MYRWSSNETENSVRFPNDFSMSQFTLEGYRIFEKNSSYETGSFRFQIREIFARFLLFIRQFFSINN